MKTQLQTISKVGYKNMEMTILPKSLQRFCLIMLLALMFTGLRMSGQELTLLSPNGGETWMTGTTQSISWSYDLGYEDMYIQFSNDNGVTWYYHGYISASDSVTSYTFTNDLYTTESARVKISLFNDPDVTDESDSSFTVIANPAYFYAPYGGQVFYSGIEIMVNWYLYEMDTVDVEYSTDGGENWILIAADHSENNILWTTPEVVSDQCMIRLSDAQDPSVYGLSPNFSIIDQPTAMILDPNGGETWNYGEIATITWSGTNLPGYLYIEFSPDGGENWSYLGYGYGTSTDGSADVNVPYTVTENALVRLKDTYYDLVLDESDAPFSVYVPPVIMYNPYEGEEFYIKDQTWISWLAKVVETVNIELTTDGGMNWSVIAENVDAEEGWYAWTITGTPSDMCAIRVSDVADPSKFDISGTFTLLATPVITLLEPVGGEIWNTDSLYTISWEYDNPNAYYVYIDISTDNGMTWNYAGYEVNQEGGGSFTWKTPAVESDQCLIRIQDSWLDFVSDTSGMFSIRTFPATPICIVSVDSATQNNSIIWEKPSSDLIDSFIVYKETDVQNVYEPIGTVPYDDEPVFTDINSNPAIKPYRYRLGFSDAEGNAYPMGSLHQTIHLAINKGVGNNWNLIWTDYLGFPVNSYNIYRSENGAGYEKIASISSSFRSYTDQDAPEGEVYYFVEVIRENGCEVSSRGISNSLSNIASNNFLAVGENPMLEFLSVYPNPANAGLNIRLNHDIESGFLQITDLTGKEIIKMNIDRLESGNKIALDVSSLHEGVYFLSIATGNSRITSKVIVRH